MRWGRRSAPHSTTSGRRSRTGRPCARRCAGASPTCGHPRRRSSPRRWTRRTPSWNGSRTTISRFWGTAPTGPGRTEAARGSRPSPARGSGCCATRAGGRPRRSRTCPHHEVVGHHGVAGRHTTPARRKTVRDAVPELLVLTRSSARSTVHRPSYLDYVGDPAVRRRRTGRRRAPVPRPLYLGRVQPGAARHSPAAAQGVRGDRARRTPPEQPRRQGAAEHHRHLPPGAALPDPRRGAVRDGARDPAPPGAAADPAVRAPGPLRALLLVHRVRPEGPVQHPGPPRHPGDPRADLRRRGHSS